jgi:hypothetical protein
MRTILAAVLFLALAVSALATTSTGTCTVTAVESVGWKKATISWASSPGGAVINNDTVLIGELRRVEFSPDTTSNSTAAYSATLVDAQGLDVLMGLGSTIYGGEYRNLVFDTNLTSGSVAGKTHNYNYYIPVYSTLILNVTGASASSKGKIIIYCRQNK